MSVALVPLLALSSLFAAQDPADEGSPVIDDAGAPAPPSLLDPAEREDESAPVVSQDGAPSGPREPPLVPKELHFDASVLAGSSAGYALGTLAPAAGIGAGVGIAALGAALGSQNPDGCEGAATIAIAFLFGGIMAGGSALACGPCGSIGAATGATGAASLSDRDLLVVALGALPGVAIGMMGPLLTLAGTLIGAQGQELVDGNGPRLGCGLMALGAALALLAGPVTVLGATSSDLLFGGLAGIDEEHARAAPAGSAPEREERAAPPSLAMAY